MPMSMNPFTCVENKTFADIKIGDSAQLTRTLTKQDIQLFAVATGDMNPAHVDEDYARSDVFHQIVAHGMWTGSMFSTLLGMQLPGPGTIYLKQNLTFLKPVRIGDTVTASITVTAKDEKHERITFLTRCVNDFGETVLEGKALVRAPESKICWDVKALPEVSIKPQSHDYVQWLKKKIDGLKPLKVAVVHPADAVSIALS